MSALHTTPRRHAGKARDLGVVVWVVALVFGMTAFVPAYFYFTATGALEKLETADFTLLIPPEIRPKPAPPDAAGGMPVNILLMGSDTRAGENAAIGGAENSLANDTTILMHISADRTRVELVSIPRDARVRLPGCQRSDGTRTYPETAKFNRAFAIGGMRGSIGDAAACVIATVEDLTDVYINEFIVIDFVGVVNVVNVLGGVPMCIPFDVTSPKAQLDLKAGPQILSGHQAISWARARTMSFSSTADRRAFEAYYGTFNGDDRGRIKRQHELIGKIFEVILARNLLLHPQDLSGLLEAAVDSMTVSPNIKDLNYLIGLAWSLRNIDRSNIVFATAPSKMHENGSDVVLLPEANEIFRNLAADLPVSGSSIADMSDAGPVPGPSTSPGTSTGTGTTETIDLLGACTVG